VRIVIDDLESPAVQDLLRLHLDSMQDSSPPESVHALGLGRLRSADVTVWSAWDGDDLLGIGALQAAAGAVEGEVKSMRTDPRHTGQGVGRALLRTIIDASRERELARLSLETGSGPAFAAAHALYLSEGFEPCGPFGTYVDDPFSRFFTLDLVPTG
jgi:putative acetyltransferase